MIKVIALETGYDGLSVRNPGDVFDMPDDVFDKRPKLKEDGEPIKDQFYEPPHWFEPVDKALKEHVEADRKAIQKQGRIPLRGTAQAQVPAIDPARQQADATAEGRMRAAAEAAVRAELVATDEAAISKRVEQKLAELRNAAGLKAPADDGAKPKAATVPSPDNLQRDSTKKP